MGRYIHDDVTPTSYLPPPGYKRYYNTTSFIGYHESLFEISMSTQKQKFNDYLQFKTKCIFYHTSSYVLITNYMLC